MGGVRFKSGQLKVSTHGEIKGAKWTLHFFLVSQRLQCRPAGEQEGGLKSRRAEQWESRRAGEESRPYSAGNAAVRHIYCICHAELEENGKLFAKWVYDFHFDSTNWSELRLRSCFRLSCIRLLPRLLLIVNLVPCRASLPAAAAAAAAVCLLWFTRAELTICRPGQVLPFLPLFCSTQLQFCFISFFSHFFYSFPLSPLFRLVLFICLNASYPVKSPSRPSAENWSFLQISFGFFGCSRARTNWVFQQKIFQ